ncbi:epsA [Symbiodinium sp. CCMP2592]|nr:epsA [Symbiodinium sp. CCMP2592]
MSRSELVTHCTESLSSSEQTTQINSRSRGHRRIGLTLGLLAGTCALSPLSGCLNQDSYLNPSITGRWEHTPTAVPILEHLAAIESPEDEFVEISEITAEDLIPQTPVYRVASGDILTLSIWDLVATDQVESLPRQVDPNGYIEIPQLGRIFVTGLTEKEVADRIAEAMLSLVADPLVSVVVEQRREQTFYLMGNVQNPAPYVVPSADFRLLQGLVGAGGIPQFIDEIYLIRQVPLDDAASRLQPEPQGLPDAADPMDGEDGEDLLDVIDDLSSPGMISGNGNGLVAPSAQRMDDPIIDLIEPSGSSTRNSSSSQSAQNSDEMNEKMKSAMLTPRWRFVDGRWVREAVPVAARKEIQKSDGMHPSDSRGQLFTQRVIRIPTKPLLAGDARYNVILRPGDIINVPPAPTGNVYIDGQVNGPGVYNLPVAGRLTLTRAITSAGGLNGLAIPERVDLTRIVGDNEQATIMLNLRAIAEGTQPDVYIKPDDRINVGTNFWATPLAVVRSGFRTSYGFGFLLDRNFGNDVFGAPPSRLR